jgi:hypothetical protein
VVDEQSPGAQLTDRATSPLRDEQRLVVVLREPVLALERPPPSAALPAAVPALLLEEAIPLPLVSAALLGGSAGLAQRVAAVATALLERELVEGLLLGAVPAALASFFHQHAPRSTIEVLGKGPDATDRV